MKRRTTPVLYIGESFGIVKMVSSNGRIRVKTQHRRFESYAILFIFREKYRLYYERMIVRVWCSLGENQEVRFDS